MQQLVGPATPEDDVALLVARGLATATAQTRPDTSTTTATPTATGPAQAATQFPAARA